MLKKKIVDGVVTYEFNGKTFVPKYIPAVIEAENTSQNGVKHTIKKYLHWKRTTKK